MCLVKYLFIIICFTYSLFAQIRQTLLPNGIWVPIGINSIYKQSTNNDKHWDSLRNNIITDVADDKTTYIGSTSAKYGYNLSSGISSNVNSFVLNETIFTNSTIGVFAIKGVKARNGVTLSNSINQAVHIKLTNPKPRANILFHTMYIQGASAPAVKITYQANYEGEKFFIKFGSSSLIQKDSYYLYFNNSSTYNNPAIPKIDIIENSNAVKTEYIQNMIDFNISDNNITQMNDDIFDIRTSIKKPTVGDSIIAYEYKNNKWEIYNSQNKASSNDFDFFNLGKSYWVKVSSQNANLDNNETKLGLITLSTSFIDKKTYENMPYGWSLATFSKDYKRKFSDNRIGARYSLDLLYSPTSMFIPLNILNSSGVNLYFSQYSSNTTNILEQNISLFISPASKTNNIADVAQKINTSVFARNTLYNDAINMRAFPAMDIKGNAGVAIISDEKFEVNSSNTSITTLSLESLHKNSNNGYVNNYGDYIFSAGIGYTANHNINASMSLSFISSTKSKATDLNTTSKITYINTLKNALEKSLNINTNQQVKFGIFLIDLHFDSSLDYTTQSNFRHFIVSSKQRLSVQEKTFTKVFQFITSGDFIIKGLTSKKINMSANLDINATINAINAVSSQTGIKASNLNTTTGSYFMITSNSANSIDDIDLQDDNVNVFNYIPKVDSTLLLDTNPIGGALGRIYAYNNIIHAPININKEKLFSTKPFTYTNSLLNISYTNGKDDNGSIDYLIYSKNYDSYSRYYTREFPGGIYQFPSIFAHVNKRITNIISQEISPSGKTYWKISDLTKSPKEWLGRRDYTKTQISDNDIQTLLHIRENKSYWVRLIDPNSKISSYSNSNKNEIKDLEIVQKNKVEFRSSNDNEIIKSTNNIKYSISFKFKNENFHKYIANNYIVSLKGNKNLFDFEDIDGLYALAINNNYAINENLIYKLSANNELGESLILHNDDIILQYKKPDTPFLYWDKNQLLVENISNEYKIEAYLDYISSNKNIRLKDKLIYPQLQKNSSLQYNQQSNELNWGSLKIIIMVIKNNQIYSDAKKTLYIPQDKAYVTYLNKECSKNVTNVAYLLNSFNNEQNKFGIQLNRLGDLHVKNDLAIIFYSKKNAIKNVTISAPKILFLTQKYNNKPIASISYYSNMIGKIFYFKMNNNIYQGRFPKTSGKTYNMDDKNNINVINVNSAQSLKVEDFFKKVDFSPSSKNSQSFYIKGQEICK